MVNPIKIGVVLTMKIMVCIKQVPDTNKVDIDEQTGVLKRAGIESKLNPYDAYALETAVVIKQKLNAEVSCITMGHPSAEEVIKEAFMIGVDHGFLVTDRKFAGADVLATSKTLAHGIIKAGSFDLIICGKQTTDGDTAQVGPAIAEHLGIPHVSWVKNIINVTDTDITVSEDMIDFVASARMEYPCLITVEKDIYQPRLPSYCLMKKSAGYPIRQISLADFEGEKEDQFGLTGSPTRVERIFPPESSHDTTIWDFDSERNASQLYEKLRELKYV
jgi:electron transfer flavoprotein beta subunit